MISINNNKIIINGKTYSNIKGNNIIVKNNGVYVDGKLITDEEIQGEVTIKFEGDLATLKSDGDVTVNGNIIGNVRASGSVECNDVQENVDCGGSVQCGDVGGSIDSGGSVRCGVVNGDIEAGGSVRYSK